jgi:hypothetical protein
MRHLPGMSRDLRINISTLTTIYIKRIRAIMDTGTQTFAMYRIYASTGTDQIAGGDKTEISDKGTHRVNLLQLTHCRVYAVQN